MQLLVADRSALGQSSIKVGPIESYFLLLFCDKQAGIQLEYEEQFKQFCFFTICNKYAVDTKTYHRQDFKDIMHQSQM